MILRNGDFNTGDLSQWSGHQNLRSYSLTTVSSPAREGAYAARFEVRARDDPLCAAGWGCYGDRSEVQMSTGEAEGQERWYSWSTMIGADFPRTTAWQVVSQWHANADGSPPIGFYAENDDLVLRFHRHSGPGQLINIVNAWRGSLRRGSWQDDPPAREVVRIRLGRLRGALDQRRRPVLRHRRHAPLHPEPVLLPLYEEYLASRKK